MSVPEVDQTAPLLRVFETGRGDVRDLQLLYELGLPMLMPDGTLYTLEVGTARSMVYRQVLVESVDSARMEQIRDLVAVTGLDDMSRQELQNSTDSDYLTTTVVFTEADTPNRLSVPDLGLHDVERADMVETVAKLVELLQPSSESADFVPDVLSAYARPSSAPDQPLREIWPLTTPFAEMPQVARWTTARSSTLSARRSPCSPGSADRSPLRSRTPDNRIDNCDRRPRYAQCDVSS